MCGFFGTIFPPSLPAFPTARFARVRLRCCHFPRSLSALSLSLMPLLRGVVVAFLGPCLLYGPWPVCHLAFARVPCISFTHTRPRQCFLPVRRILSLSRLMGPGAFQKALTHIFHNKQTAHSIHEESQAACMPQTRDIRITWL